MFGDEEKGGGKNPSKKLRVGSSPAAQSGVEASLARKKGNCQEMTRAHVKRLLQPANYTKINYIALDLVQLTFASPDDE